MVEEGISPDQKLCVVFSFRGNRWWIHWFRSITDPSSELKPENKLKSKLSVFRPRIRFNLLHRLPLVFATFHFWQTSLKCSPIWDNPINNSKWCHVSLIQSFFPVYISDTPFPWAKRWSLVGLLGFVRWESKTVHGIIYNAQLWRHYLSHNT